MSMGNGASGNGKDAPSDSAGDPGADLEGLGWREMVTFREGSLSWMVSVCPLRMSCLAVAIIRVVSCGRPNLLYVFKCSRTVVVILVM